MRREGRMHGAFVRESKHSPWHPAKAPNKPTNHSRCTGKCLSNRVRCKGCADLPVTKTKGKTKGGLKAKAFNIVNNYKMQEWRVCDSSPPSTSTSKKPMIKLEKPLVAWDLYADADLDYNSGSDVDEENSDNCNNEVEEVVDSSWKSGIVLPIESLLRARKVPEVVFLDVDEESSGHSNNEMEEAEFPEVISLEGIEKSNATDSDDSWSGVDMTYDGEEVSDDDGYSWADDWSLVEEEL